RLEIRRIAGRILVRGRDALVVHDLEPRRLALPIPGLFLVVPGLLLVGLLFLRELLRVVDLLLALFLLALLGSLGLLALLFVLVVLLVLLFLLLLLDLGALGAAVLLAECAIADRAGDAALLTTDIAGVA